VSSSKNANANTQLKKSISMEEREVILDDKMEELITAHWTAKPWQNLHAFHRMSGLETFTTTTAAIYGIFSSPALFMAAAASLANNRAITFRFNLNHPSISRAIAAVT
jgi:hypothetical protein